MANAIKRLPAKTGPKEITVFLGGIPTPSTNGVGCSNPTGGIRGLEHTPRWHPLVGRW